MIHAISPDIKGEHTSLDGMVAISAATLPSGTMTDKRYAPDSKTAMAAVVPDTGPLVGLMPGVQFPCEVMVTEGAERLYKVVERIAASGTMLPTADWAGESKA